MIPEILQDLVPSLKGGDGLVAVVAVLEEQRLVVHRDDGPVKGRRLLVVLLDRAPLRTDEVLSTQGVGLLLGGLLLASEEPECDRLCTRNRFRIYMS